MSFVTTQPEMLSTAAGNLASLGVPAPTNPISFTLEKA